MFWRLVGCLLVGCSSPATTSLPAPPTPVEPLRIVPTPIPDLEPMFAIPTPSTIETRCRTFPLSPTSGHNRRQVTYEFVDMPLGAIESGPRVRDRERRATPMTNVELHRPFARRADHITRCWKWFSATHAGGDTSLDVHLAIDAFGATGAITIVNKAADAELAACIRDQFAAPIHVAAPRGHESRVQARIELVREDQPAWTKTPPRPARITSEPVPEWGSTCVRVAAPPVVSRLYPLRVTDFDPSRSRVPRRTHTSSLRVGCILVENPPRKADIRSAVKSNWGAYEACHAEARARMPELAGAITAKLVFDVRGGEPTLASVTGAGDGELHACLDRALEEIWLDPPTASGVIEAHFTFDLVTDPPPAVRERADWNDVFARAATPIAGCHARRELVQDRVAAAPWLDDARVRAAYHELARYIATLSPADANACLVEVETMLRAFAGLDAMTRPGEAERFEGRLDRLVALAPLAKVAAWGPTLQLVIALLYRKQPERAAEAALILEQLMLTDLHDLVEPTVEERAQPIGNGCAM